MNTHNEPSFVTDHDRDLWESFSDEKKERYIKMADYLRVEYPDVPLDVVTIGTAMISGA